jgi:hypothetical protein
MSMNGTFIGGKPHARKRRVSQTSKKSGLRIAVYLDLAVSFRFFPFYPQFEPASPGRSAKVRL